jgi:hypothetical protein
VADHQGDETGRQRADNIPVAVTKIDGLVQLSTDFFKSLPFQCQSGFGSIPFGNGGSQVFPNTFGTFIRVKQTVADE